MNISNEEAKSIIISVLALSLALTIAQFGVGILAMPGRLAFLMSFFAITVGTGFVLHELAHKYVAIQFGGYAEFKMWVQGLIFALLTSLIGLVFVAPGAVYIYAPKVTKMQNALISLAGPLTNLILALVFSALGLVFPLSTGGMDIWFFASKINIWLGLFNMIPIFPLDGSKIFDWNVFVWGFFGLVFLALFLF